MNKKFQNVRYVINLTYEGVIVLDKIDKQKRINDKDRKIIVKNIINAVPLEQK